VKILDNGYTELSESFTSESDLYTMEHYIADTNTNIINIKNIVQESTEFYKMLFRIICKKDIENIVLIVPQSKREQYKFLENEDWVFFDSYADKLMVFDKDSNAVCIR